MLSIFLFFSCVTPTIFLCACQIAPAESPDVTERMVIITGTPEAQFKVKHHGGEELYVKEYTLFSLFLSFSFGF